MRLISWNVNGRRGRGAAAQWRALRCRQPDVIALQEVTRASLPSWRDELSAADFLVVDSSGRLAVAAPEGHGYTRRYFNLIASRFALHEFDCLRVAYPERYLAAITTINGHRVAIHNAHLPPGSTRGLIKVEMFRALYGRMAIDSPDPRILCGDFNTPRSETSMGEVAFWGSSHPRHKNEWDAAERAVVLGLAEHDLADTYRALHGYEREGQSWVVRRQGRETGRRYDHVFATASLRCTRSEYLDAFRTEGLSDHAPIEADFAGI